jgi:hypothetical protein
MFFDNREIGAGQVEYTCVSAEEGSGKTMQDLKKVRVFFSPEICTLFRLKTAHLSDPF